MVELARDGSDGQWTNIARVSVLEEAFILRLIQVSLDVCDVYYQRSMCQI